MFTCFQTDVMEFHVENSQQTFHQGIIDYISDDSISFNNNYSTIGLTAKHGEPNLVDLDYEWSLLLKTMIQEVSSQYFENITSEKLNLNKIKVECWYICLDANDMSLSHVHPGSDISGCYYITVPKETKFNQGAIVFIDPRPAARYSKLLSGRQMIINPKPGLGLVFPGWLEHYVVPHTSREPRISLAWNINLLN